MALEKGLCERVSGDVIGRFSNSRCDLLFALAPNIPRGLLLSLLRTISETPQPCQSMITSFQRVFTLNTEPYIAA